MAQPTPSQKFVIRHEFPNLSKMQYGKRFYGAKQRHFDCAWRLCIFREKGNLLYGIECLRNQDNWSIEATCHVELITSQKRWTAKGKHWFKFDHYWNKVRWNEVRKCLDNGKLVLEVDVAVERIVNNLGGENQEQLQRKPENSQSDNVVVVVEGNKIEVAKQLLISNSTYFKSVNYKKTKQLQLQNVLYDDFLNLLDILEGIMEIDDETIDGILDAADILKFKETVKKCEKYLMEKSRKPIGEKMVMADEFNLQELKTQLTRFENSNVCVIQTDSLRCTVCFEIFDANPKVLECGHSFCSHCTQNLAESSETRYYGTFNCPVCRKPNMINKTATNYTVKAILDGMDELSKNEMQARRANDNTLDVTVRRERVQASERHREKFLQNERLLQKCALSEKKAVDLENEKRALNLDWLI